MIRVSICFIAEHFSYSSYGWLTCVPWAPAFGVHRLRLNRCGSTLNIGRLVSNSSRVGPATLESRFVCSCGTWSKRFCRTRVSKNQKFKDAVQQGAVVRRQRQDGATLLVGAALGRPFPLALAEFAATGWRVVRSSHRAVSATATGPPVLTKATAVWLTVNFYLATACSSRSRRSSMAFVRKQIGDFRSCGHPGMIHRLPAPRTTVERPHKDSKQTLSHTPKALIRESISQRRCGDFTALLGTGRR